MSCSWLNAISNRGDDKKCKYNNEFDMKAEEKESCPEFPFWGAHYPDACCVEGELQDLDYCDENGNLYDKGEGIPCPFCRTEEFIEYDYFNKVDLICEELMEDDSKEQYEAHIGEAKEKAREWYLNWIKSIKEKYR